MLFPEFLKKGDTVGICAPSAGVGHKLEKYELSLQVIRSQGYEVRETASVRNDRIRSTGAAMRAKELDSLIGDRQVKALIAAAGGDFMYEIMPKVDLEHIRQEPKWLCGMSDPTNLLFTVTTALDIATLYGFNGAGFTFDHYKPQEVFFDILKGEIPVQKSYRRYRSFIEAINDETRFKNPVRWSAKNELQLEGRLIGGCIEVISKLIGTRFDHVSAFMERYRDDGIIWYFDIFDMSAYNFYLTLLQFKNAGWFRYCKGVLIGRVAFPKIEDEKLDYAKAADKALGKIPHIMEMDIGHTDPAMVLINGAMAKVRYRDGKGSIAFALK